MFTVVTEAAKGFSPLTFAISVLITRTYIKIYELFEIIAYKHRIYKLEKNIKQITYSLKLEYPHESEEYVEYLARNIVRESY